jgi:hypothetical protein
MKKYLFWFLLFSLFFFSCYDMNTPSFPNLAGFHKVRNSPFGIEGIKGMAGHGKQVVAVSGSSVAWSDDEGVTWTEVTAIAGKPPAFLLNCVTWGEGYYLAGGAGGIALWSEDGKNWYGGNIGPMSPKNINAVAAGVIQNRTVFVAAGDDGRIAWALGHPRGTWYMSDLCPFGQVDNDGENIYGLAWGYVRGNKSAGVFVAVGENGKIAFMSDLSGKWYGARGGSAYTLRGVAFGNDRFVAVGDSGLIQTSFDPAEYTWTIAKDVYIESRPLYAIIFDPAIKRFAVIGVNSLIAFSESGSNWDAASFQNQGRLGSSGDLSALACTAARIVLGCKDGLLLYSN